MHTEKEQAQSIEYILREIQNIRKAQGSLNQPSFENLKGMFFYTVFDRTREEFGSKDLESYGVIRMDGTRKPAYQTLKSGMDSMKNNVKNSLKILDLAR